MRLFIFEDGHMVQVTHDPTEHDFEAVAEGVVQIVETDGLAFYNLTGEGRTRIPQGVLTADEHGPFTTDRERPTSGPPDYS